MRILYLTICVVCFLACHHSKKATVTQPIKEEVSSEDKSVEDATKLIGKVTYLVNGNGCLSIVVLNAEENTDNKLVLIPRTPLTNELAKEGTLILFNYRTLKMKNPEGCLKGIPVELSNVTQKVK